MAADASPCPAPRSSELFKPILHQVWLPPSNTSSEALPKTLRPMVERWRTVLGSSWERRLWTPAQNRQLWRDHFPSYLALYDSYPHPVQRADASRLVYMFVYGGIYADLDVAPCNTINDALAPLSDGELQLLLVKAPKRFGRGVTNHFYGSKPGHPFWAFALSRLQNKSQAPVMWSTGPYFVADSWRAYVQAVRAAGCHDEALWNRTVKTLAYEEFESRVAGHHWSSMWHHGGEAMNEPGFKAWVGLNASNMCKEGRFTRLVEQTWHQLLRIPAAKKND